MSKGPLDLVSQIAIILDELDIPYALGGSLASSLIGEPRSTVDVDIAIKLDDEAAAALLERASAEFYVPIESARAAIQARSSFNLIDTTHGLKVDLFVLGDGMQLDYLRETARRLNLEAAHRRSSGLDDGGRLSCRPFVRRLDNLMPSSSSRACATYRSVINSERRRSTRLSSPRR